MNYVDLELDLRVLKQTYDEYIKKFKKPSEGLELGIQHLDAEVRKLGNLIAKEVLKED